MAARSRTALERIAVLEERQDSIDKAVAGINAKMDILLEEGHRRGEAMTEVQSAVRALQGGVVGLKQDTAIIRSGMVIARVGRRTATFAAWALPIGAGLFVWLGERWDLLLNFIRGSGR